MEKDQLIDTNIKVSETEQSYQPSYFDGGSIFRRGILSIFLCIGFGFIGIIVARNVIAEAKDILKSYELDPKAIKKVKTGRNLSRIGISIIAGAALTIVVIMSLH